MIWTIPNILTIARLLAAPGVAVMFLYFDRPYADWFALLLFLIAFITLLSNLNIAANIYKKLVKIKKNIKNKKNISNFLKSQKKELRNNFKIKIDYLELRNEKNLKVSNTLKKNSRLFIAYYLNSVRLIDNL